MHSKDSNPLFAPSNLEIVVASVLVFATLFFTWKRLFYGVDFTDESFYIALSQRLALGDVPLRDEQNIAQFAAFLYMPFVKGYLYLYGTDGMVLFCRHLHLIFTMLVGAGVFMTIRSYVRWPVAMMVAVLCVAYVPFNIHGLSYNTMGSGFLTLGLFLGAWDGKTGLRKSVLCGFFLCLAAIVYPPLGIAVMVFAFLLLFEKRCTNAKKIACAAGALIAVCIPLALLMWAGFDSLKYMLEFIAANKGGQTPGIQKIPRIFLTFWTEAPKVRILLLLCVLLLVSRLVKIRWAQHFAFILPLFSLLYLSQANSYTNHYFVISVSLLGPFVYLHLSKHEPARNIFVRVWIPSFIAGLVTAWSSGNGTINGSLGMFPACVATTFLMIYGLEKLFVFNESRVVLILKRISIGSIPLVMVAVLMVGGYRGVYGEIVPLKKLSEKIQAGPFRGLKTTEEKKAFIEQFAHDLKAYSYPNDRILVFFDFPAGYLFSELRPAVNSVWTSVLGDWPAVNRTPAIKYYERTGILPNLVFMFARGRESDDRLVGMVKSNLYQKIGGADQYEIYRLRK